MAAYDSSGRSGGVQSRCAANGNRETGPKMCAWVQHASGGGLIDGVLSANRDRLGCVRLHQRSLRYKATDKPVNAARPNIKPMVSINKLNFHPMHRLANMRALSGRLRSLSDFEELGV
jgi:hypothetical protein